MNLDNEVKAEINNKLQTCKTVLERLEEGKLISKQIVRLARRDLREAINLLKKKKNPL